MRVAVRSDASVTTGSGHVMRCLALAAGLRAAGAEILFLCRAHPGHLGDMIEAAGHQLRLLPPGDGQIDAAPAHAAWLGTTQENDAAQSAAILQAEGPWHWLIIDHYALDARWERRMRAHVQQIFVVDDLADRAHDCDILLDQNLNGDMARRYDGLLPAHCRRLLGPTWSLLRDEFPRARATARRRDGRVGRILIFFGGVDAGNESAKALQAIALLGRPEIAVDVVLGLANSHRASIEALAADLPQVRVLGPQRDMAPLMEAADLAIGAGGVSMWERCCLGLPSVVLALAENQRPASQTMATEGIVLYLGAAAEVDAPLLAAALRTLCATPALVQRMGQAGRALVDGRGLERILGLFGTDRIMLRRARAEDGNAMYQWRNAEEVRRHAGSSETFTLEQHLAWFHATLENAQRVLLVGEIDGRSIGVLRYDRSGERVTISVYLVPGNQGKGYGARLIDSGSEWLRHHWPDISAVDAHIRTENLASIKAFAQAGFTEAWQIRTKNLKDD